MAAASRGDVEALRLLLDAQANVNTKDSAGETALMMAASDGNPQAVRLLLKHGETQNQKSRELRHRVWFSVVTFGKRIGLLRKIADELSFRLAFTASHRAPKPSPLARRGTEPQTPGCPCWNIDQWLSRFRRAGRTTGLSLASR
jgi:Ankyrin repeats (3 copies)